MRDFAIFFLRVIFGAIFILHGAQKLFGMFGGIGLDGAVKMMEGLGFPYYHKVALLWSGIEFFGGIFIVMGILTRYAAALTSLIMIISIYKINLSYGFFIQNGGYEYNLLLLGVSIFFVFTGGGKWSSWDI